MSPSTHIRPARPDDAAFISGLCVRFAECELPPWRSASDISAGTARQLLEALRRGNSDVSALAIAEEQGEPVGFAWVLMLADFYTGEPIGKLSEIAVSRSGAGTGAALIAWCERWARERGAHLMTLNALQGNSSARRFYERGGYAPEYVAYVKRLDEKS